MQNKSKRCSKCRETKLLEEFHLNKVSRDGYNNWCKLCKRVYYNNNTEQEKLRAKLWRIDNIERCKKNKEKRRKQIKEYNRKYHKQWRKEPAKFSLYSKKISAAEAVRNNNGSIETKCNYCGKWFTPTNIEVHNRCAALDNYNNGERRLYCSNLCKFECSIYRKILWPKDFKSATSREVQPELRQLVFKRDNYKCVLCDSTKSLHCHHLTGVEQNPIESADVDNCITLCKSCHEYVHSKEGCRYHELKKCKSVGE